MATALAPQVTLTVRFENQRVTVRFSKDDKVSTVIKEAAKLLKEEPGGLSILYQGLEIPDNATIQVGLVACSVAGGVAKHSLWANSNAICINMMPLPNNLLIQQTQFNTISM